MKNKRVIRVVAIAVVSVMAFGLISQTVSATQTYSISGKKFNDENFNGVDDGEPVLENWGITIESDTYPYETTLTDNLGNYSFIDLQPGTYNVCELENEDWDQTYPNTCDGCHIVEIVDINLVNVDFGNYNGSMRDDDCDDPCEDPEPIPGCMDLEALNYNPDADIDNESCEYEESEIPGCMNSTALNYNPEATIEDNSCTFSGGSTPQPNLKINKTVDKDSADAGDIVTYTVLIENIGRGKARSIVLWDELLEGFTYVNEDLEGRWEIGDLLKKEERTISFEVLVSEDIEAGLYANIAKITSTNYRTMSDDAEVEVHVPEVKGEEIIIAIEPDPEPIIKVLPNTGTSSFAWFILGGLGILLVGVLGLISIFTKRYKQLIQLSLFSILIVGSLIALVYPFMPVIKYNLSIPFVEADTSIIGMDEKMITEAEKVDGDWLIIPSIGVKIPIVLGQDDSALEEGAWLLPDGSTPDLGGNTALAAHRYKYRPPHEETFYLLNKVSPGDVMYVYWKGEKYEYTMAYSKVVKPEAIEVLDQTEESIITLITCEPLFSDKNRLIVVGELNK